MSPESCTYVASQDPTPSIPHRKTQPQAFPIGPPGVSAATSWLCFPWATESILHPHTCSSRSSQPSASRSGSSTGTVPRSRSVPTQACSTSNQGSRRTRAQIRSEPVFSATALWRTGLLEGFERDLQKATTSAPPAKEPSYVKLMLKSPEPVPPPRPACGCWRVSLHSDRSPVDELEGLECHIQQRDPTGNPWTGISDGIIA